MTRTRALILAAGLALLIAVTTGITYAATRPDQGGHAVDECQRLITERLKAPSTAQWGAVEIIDWRNGNWRITGQVDAQNGFGATLRQTYECQLHTPDGGATWVANRVNVG